MTRTPFLPSRAAGLDRLARFQAHMGRTYARSRNHDYGRHDHSRVSQLSPWIRTRLITEQETVAAALARHSFSSAEKFVQEVCWRTYWKGWLQHRPSVWSSYIEARNAAFAEARADTRLSETYEAALNGRTGIAVFDAWMTELAETGYLHNHARMWASSIWIHTLRLPWALGADHFLHHLIDGDAASNTLSWRWVAGLHTEGKTYAARPDNIETYAATRFRAELGPDWRRGLDRLVMPAAPIAGFPNPPAGRLPEISASPAGPVGLLLCEEDLHPASLIPATSQVRAVAGVCLADARSPRGASGPAGEFSRGAVDSGLCAAAQLWAAPATRLDDTAPLGEALQAWARDHMLSDLVIAEPPVGWARTQLDPLRLELARIGLTLHYLRRDWDTQFWPHAQRGFFALKKKLPSILDRLELTG